MLCVLKEYKKERERKKKIKLIKNLIDF